MAPTKGVRIKLDKQRVLRFSNWALIQMEERVGLTLDEAGRGSERGSLRAITALVWAGLLHENPELEFREAAELVELARLPEIGDACAEAIKQAFGVAKEDSAGKAAAAS